MAKSNLCSGCGGWGYIWVKAGIPNETKQCFTCKGSGKHEHKWERIEGLIMCKCGKPLAPPKPKGEHGKG